MRWMLLAAVGLVGCSGGCRDQGSGPGPDAQIWDGALGPEAQVAEAGVDVWQPPSEGPPAVLRDWCDKPLVRFPYEWREGGFVQPGGGWVYVGWHNRPMTDIHMRLLDLDTCVEYALVPEWWQVCYFTYYVGLSHQWFVLTGRQCPDQGGPLDILLVDLKDWDVSVFRPSPDLDETALEIHGRYLVSFAQNLEDAPARYRNYLFIADLETGEATQLLERGWSVHFSISDRYLVWSNNDNIYYLNLQTWERERIEEPVPRAQVLPRTDGDLAAWMETDDPEAGPFDMVVYHLDTGEREVVAEDIALPGVLPRLELSRDLVLYRTGEYGTQEDPGEGSGVGPGALRRTHRAAAPAHERAHLHYSARRRSQAAMAGLHHCGLRGTARLRSLLLGALGAARGGGQPGPAPGGRAGVRAAVPVGGEAM